MVSSHQLNYKNNGVVLLLKTILRHWNCFLPSVATDGKDGNGLKLEKIGPLFSSFDAMPSNITKIIIMVSSPWQNSFFDVFLVVLQVQFVYRPCYTRQFFLQLFVARQVARKISRVTPQFWNLQRQQNVALRVARKVEMSSVWHVHRNLQGNFMKIRQSEPVFCSQEISSWWRKSCKQFPPGAFQVAKKYCERVTPLLQLAMFFSRHRCETSCKKNCLV